MCGLYCTCVHRHAGRQADARGGGIKQIQVQLTPFTTQDIPLTVRELQQLRHTIPGGTFDVYPLSLLGRWGLPSLKGFKTVCVSILLLLSRFKAC